MSATAERTFIRPDGNEKVTGAGRYTADLTVSGQLHARFRYADHPRARILSIDTSRARALPGVLAVVTHEDVPDVLYGQLVKDRRLFAKEEVRYEAEVIAGVAALTPEIAQEAAGLIEVEYEPLEPVTDPELALAPDAPLVHADWESYEAEDQMVRDRNVLGHSTIVNGDAEAAMAEADVVIKSRYLADGSHGVPIEPRAVVAQWQGDRVTVWTSSQTPFVARSGVAETLGIPESKVRIIVPLLGGGFGSKCDFHYEAHVAALARAAGRPVKLVFTRQEEFVAPDHRRESIAIELETGVRRDGTILARRARLVLDGGAYCGEGGFFAQLAAMHACGPYVMKSVDVAAKLVYTNNQPSGSIRAPTAPQTCWAVEQHMDEIAAALDIDPVELRRRTLIEEGTESPTGQVFGKLGMKETLERAVEMIGYGQELPENEAIGVACGWWPSFGSEAGAYVKLNGDGTGTIITGAQENGSGAVMGLPLIAAEVLGMRPDDFSILYQDTDAGPWDMGSSGSQTTFNNGRAVGEAAREVREKLLEMAAEQLEIDPADLELADGEARVKGSPQKAVSIAELAGSGTPILGKGSGEVPAQPEAPACTPDSGCIGRLGLESFLEPQLITHAVHIRVDPATGVVRVLRVAAAHDSGVILNPSGADGQVRGGVVMGIGQALSEGMQLEQGRQLNPHLLDYKLVTSADAPSIEVAWVETPAVNGGPNGSKGIGEPPCVPTPGAVANAVAKAIGTRIHRLPMTPERLWEAMQ
ncbi:MAG TPA: xanthine dehydrogenase family protein molybdopterin-binding subunit [Solirubrobacteraceae bacterium]|nr:xanthine dehydrogenase family protein molybdopterin-binding subunit [Solirubrobacteraceae bacterium]